jgi:hypothetical protein
LFLTIIFYYTILQGACLSFKSEYVRLAKKTTKDYPQVEFYAVSCQEHKDVCQHHSVQGYPSLVTFGAGSNLGQPIKFGGKYTSAMLAKRLALDDAVPEEPAAEISRRMQDNEGSDDENTDGQDNEETVNGETGSDQASDGDENTDGQDDEETVNGETGSDQASDGDENTDGQDNEERDNGETGSDQASDGDENTDGQDNEERDNGETGSDQASDGDENTDELNDPPTPDGEEDQDNGSDGDASDAEVSPDVEEDDPLPSLPVANRPGFGFGGAAGAPLALGGDGHFAGASNTNANGGRPVRRSGAGAARARTEKKDMDRWKAQIATRKKEIEDRRKGLGRVIAPIKGGLTGSGVGRKGVNRPVEKSTPETMTTNMKARTPGTAEYEERRKALLERMAKIKAKREGKHLQVKPGSSTTKDIVFTKESLPFTKDVRKQTFVSKQAEKVPIVKRFVKMTPEEETILDASLSFVSGLRYGVFMAEGALTLPRKMALKNWLDFLSVSLPPEWGLHRLIDDLRRQINFVAKSDANLNSVLQAHPMPREVWSMSCAGKGKRVGMGFSCGFWKLLHIATVGVAEHKGGLNLVESGMIDANHKTFAPIEAADTIKDYIAMFFNCEECKGHFVEHYNNCDNNRRCDRLTDDEVTATIADWKELALWMWEVHNEVSVRIASERRKKKLKRKVSATTDSDVVAKQNEVMVIWPTIGKCLACFEGDGTWDEPEVFTMLENTYWYVHLTFWDTIVLLDNL